MDAARGGGEVSGDPRHAPKTRYGFPDMLPPFTPFPQEIPWGTPIAQLSGWWLEIECKTHFVTGMPLRLLAARAGWNRTLRGIAPALKCSKCGQPPVRVDFVSDAKGDAGRHGSTSMRHRLVG